MLFAAAIGSAGASPLGVPGTHGGVVATTERTAAQAGAEVLRNGGNAIDAAAAVAFALNVVEPQSSGIGGGGFTVIYLADQNRTVTVDSREAAPAAASPDMFVPFTRSNGGGFPVASTSGLAVGVPGMVRGVALMLDRWGTMSFQDVLQPAIRLAANGFRVSKRLEQSIRSPRLGNEIGNPAYDEARKVFRPDGKPLEAGDRLVQPALAGTLRLLAEQGPDAFYSGKLAKAIVATQKATRGDAPAGAGRMALDDLKGYEAHVRPPVTGKYRGVTLKGMGPPSSGGLTALEILKLMERFPLGDAEAGFGFGQPRTLNTMVEAMRLAFADRAVWMGDSDFVPVPAAGLLSEPYIERRSSLIDPDKRRQNVQADDPRPYDAALRDGDETLAAVRPHPRKGRNTTHFTVVDAQGNIVSYTNTVESAWGTGLMVPGYGFLLNNELTDFNFVPTADSDPEHYNPGANDVAPGKRPRSSICPVILFQGDTPVAAYGSPGGSTIINSVVNVTVNLIDHGMSIQHAVDAPRISQTSADGSISREIGFDRESVLRLEKLGHEVRFPREIGSVQAIVVDPRDGTRYGAADRRRTGSVINVEPK
ncbi:MAG: gamma-glutamyltransferase [Ectothiorhodospiraceae bacterium]